MITATELAETTERLISLPEVYFQVKKLIDDEHSDLSQIGAIVSRDPALTARLLKIANSALFGMAARVETVTRAISLLGTEQLHDLLLAVSVTGAISGTRASGLDMRGFWGRSIYCALAAKVIANRCNVLDSERLFVGGLLHEIGIMIMHLGMPGKMVEVGERAATRMQPLPEIEQEMLGFDRADAGGALLAHWRLPPMLCEAVACHLEPGKAEEFRFETNIVHAASVLALHNGSGEEAGAILRRIDSQAALDLALTAEAIAGIDVATAEQIDQTLSLFVRGNATSNVRTGSY